MSTKNIFIVSVILFTALTFILPYSFIPPDLGNTILTVVAFLFGIIAGFYIVVTTTDYNSLKNILAAETAGWISLYQNVLMYNKEAAAKLAEQIDQYIRRTFDFEIIDYTRSTQEEFKQLRQLVQDLLYNVEKSSIHQNIGGVMAGIINARQQLTVLGAKTLSIFPWTILFLLATIFIVSLYGLRNGEVFFDLVAVAISSSIILVLLLVRDLDLYIWNEKTFGYDIFENVLRSIGKLPYYPAESIKKGRVKPHEKEYRMGTYIDVKKGGERTIETIKV